MYAVRYCKPHSASDARQMLADDPDARYLAGGMTLIPTLKQRLLRVSRLVDVTGLPGFTDIRVSSDVVTIGAAVTHDCVARSGAVAQVIPALATLAGGIGDPQVRNRGTLGGSVANNDPAADYPAGVLALRAAVVTDRREIASDVYFRGMFATSLNAGELVTAIRFQVPDAAAYIKLPNPASRYATVGIFVARFRDAIRVAVTGAGPGVFRWTEAEARLAHSFEVSSVAGLVLDAKHLNQDLHATAEYRAHVASVVLANAVAHAAS
jgi:carbon-monoxide dehydrogenase medium subunit